MLLALCDRPMSWEGFGDSSSLMACLLSQVSSRQEAQKREKRKRGLGEEEKEAAGNWHRAWLHARAGLLASNVRAGIYLNGEKRGQLHSARLIPLFYSENKRDFELLRDRRIRSLSFQPQSTLLLISTSLEFFLKYFNVDKRKERERKLEILNIS